MKRYWILLIILTINTSFANNHSQTIYQYKNQYNVTEFTDIANSEKILTQKLEIKKTSMEQQEAINRLLENIKIYNEDFNQRYYDNQKRQYETKIRKAKAKKQAEQQAEAEHNKEVSELRRHKRRKHLRKDRIRKALGKNGHSNYGVPK